MRLRASLSPQPDLVLIGAGSPCQDLMGVENSRSKLFYEIPQVVKLFRETFHSPVHFFVENMLNMSPDNRRNTPRFWHASPCSLTARTFLGPVGLVCSGLRDFPSFPKTRRSCTTEVTILEWEFPITRSSLQSWVDPG